MKSSNRLRLGYWELLEEYFDDRGLEKPLPGSVLRIGNRKVTVLAYDAATHVYTIEVSK